MTDQERINALEQEVLMLALCVQGLLDATSKGPRTTAAPASAFMQQVVLVSGGRKIAEKLSRGIIERLEARAVE